MNYNKNRNQTKIKYTTKLGERQKHKCATMRNTNTITRHMLIKKEQVNIAVLMSHRYKFINIINLHANVLLTDARH